jgi:hypothetical protein
VQFLVHAARSFLTHGDPAYCDTICDPLPPDPCDPYLTAMLRELLDYPLTADDLDNNPDADT